MLSIGLTPFLVLLAGMCVVTIDAWTTYPEVRGLAVWLVSFTLAALWALASSLTVTARTLRSGTPLTRPTRLRIWRATVGVTTLLTAVSLGEIAHAFLTPRLLGGIPDLAAATLGLFFASGMLARARGYRA